MTSDKYVTLRLDERFSLREPVQTNCPMRSRRDGDGMIVIEE